MEPITEQAAGVSLHMAADTGACHDVPVLTPSQITTVQASAPARRMRRAQRVEAILSELSTTGNVHVGDLSERFGVSEATLRRDLTLLEEQDLLTRTHGGALAQNAGFSLPARQRDQPEAEAVRSIARLAARSLPDGPHVAAFTGGEITSEVARQVCGRSDLTIVTTALNIAMDAATRGSAKLLLIGGVTRPGSLELAGPWTEQIAASINIGTLFIHGEGLSATGGLTSSDETQVRTTQALIGRAQRVVVVAPGAAIGHVALTRIAAASGVSEVVTDASAQGPQLSALQDAGVSVGLAMPQTA